MSGVRAMHYDTDTCIHVFMYLSILAHRDQYNILYDFTSIYHHKYL